MQINDLTPEQDAAFADLRRLHNRDNPDNTMTKAQLIQAYIDHAFKKAVDEATEKIDGQELRKAFDSADSTKKSQIKAILGL
jgi:hypothetical protein